MKKLPYKGRELMLSMINELDSLDFLLLHKNNHIKDTLNDIKGICSDLDIGYLVSPKTLCKNFEWIESKYSITEDHLVCFQHFDTLDIPDLFDEVIRFISREIKSMVRA